MNSANGQKAVLRLDGELNIYRAAELKQTLLAALHDIEVLELDLSGVTEIDSAGLQLLMLAKNTLQSAGGELLLMAQSEIVADVIALLDLGPYFGDQVVLPARADAGRASTIPPARHAHGS